jgi:Holliday junction resolvase RusA-like endonuclease
MVIHQVTVVGNPKGQPRARAFAFKGRVRMYDPATAEGWKSQIAAAIAPVATPYLGPVAVALVFRFARPASHCGKSGVPRPAAPVAPTGKPDLDNLEKAVLDALTTIGVWRDDSQVVGMTSRKQWAVGRPPGCDITITDPFIERDDIEATDAIRQGR